MASVLQPGFAQTRWPRMTANDEMVIDSSPELGGSKGWTARPARKKDRRKGKMSSSSAASGSKRVHVRRPSPAQSSGDLPFSSAFRDFHVKSAVNAFSSSDEGDDECATPRASDINHTSYMNDSYTFTSESTSASSSRYFTSSDTSPASPGRKASASRTPPSAYRKQTTDEEFITRLRAGLTSSASPATNSGTSPSIRRPRNSASRQSRTQPRGHTRTYSFTIGPETVQQLLSFSVYFVVTIVAGVALIGILAGSYALSVGDDLKYRFIEAKISAREAVDLAKKEAKRIRIRLEKKAKQVGDSWSANTGYGAASTEGPNYRELAAHIFQQVTPPFIYSVSAQCYDMSSSAYTSIYSIYACATRRNRTDSQGTPSRHQTPKHSSASVPPRPPLRSLIPSLGIAVLLALLAFLRNTSFWQTQEAAAASTSAHSKRRDDERRRG